MEPLTTEEEELLVRALKKIDFFSYIPLKRIERVLGQFSKVPVRKRATVIRQGTTGAALYIIKSGRYAVVKRRGFFSRTRVAELMPGDFFGEMSLIYDAPTSADVQALEAGELFSISRSDFQRAVEDMPEVVDLLRTIADARQGRPAAGAHRDA
jgi:CRP-like cAMP-binding protein